MKAAGARAQAWWGQVVAARPPAPLSRLHPAQGALFLRVVADGARVRRHLEILRWLQGELQQLLPHDILVAAWGEFERWRVRFDVVSSLPGVRTARLAACPVDDIVRRAHERWVQAGRRPLLLRAEEVIAAHRCGCPVHTALLGMRALLVHGASDRRSGEESLYLVLSAKPLPQGGASPRLPPVVDALVAQIDGAFRRVAALPLPAGLPPERGEECWLLDLSHREREILESVCQGRTNGDIAASLAISPYTVKNHMQRIFRKIGVRNRTQATARYLRAARQAASRLAARAPSEDAR